VRSLRGELETNRELGSSTPTLAARMTVRRLCPACMDNWAEPDGIRCASCAKANPNPKPANAKTQAPTPQNSAHNRAYDSARDEPVITASWQSPLAAFDDGLI
jgi:hypothetical protein